MFSLLISLILNSNNDLPVLKITTPVESDKIVVLKDENSRKTVLIYEEDLPVAKESISLEIVKFHPLKRTVGVLRKSLSDVTILPRRGSLVKLNNGIPLLELEERTVAKIEINKTIAPVEQQSSEEPRYMINEDRRLFSGRLRNRIFIGSR
ncbi:MAG: hypothetical protein WCJ72_04855 [Chryseobacterium sp.]